MPTVPDPSTSPARSRVFLAACSTMRAHGWCMSPMFPRERSSPFTRATISSFRSPSSSGCHHHRAEARREVLPLRRAEPDLHLGTLQVAGRPVVHDREAADLPVLADDDGRLELVVELVRPLRVRDLVLRARRSRPGSRSRTPARRTTPARSPGRATRAPSSRAARRRRSRGRKADTAPAAAGRPRPAGIPRARAPCPHRRRTTAASGRRAA